MVCFGRLPVWVSYSTGEFLCVATFGSWSLVSRGGNAIPGGLPVAMHVGFSSVLGLDKFTLSCAMPPFFLVGIGLPMSTFRFIPHFHSLGQAVNANQQLGKAGYNFKGTESVLPQGRCSPALCRNQMKR